MFAVAGCMFAVRCLLAVRCWLSMIVGCCLSVAVFGVRGLLFCLACGVNWLLLFADCWCQVSLFVVVCCLVLFGFVVVCCRLLLFVVGCFDLGVWCCVLIAGVFL